MAIIYDEELLQKLKRKNYRWFSPAHMQFFGDVAYWVVRARNGKPFLLRKTFAWTDMFDGKKKRSWALNVIEDDLTIGPIVRAPDGGPLFPSLEDVEKWLDSHDGEGEEIGGDEA